jgi:hypothetical protein
MSNAPRNFAEFWPHYVLAHRHPLTRGFHLVGTVLGWSVLAAAVALRRLWLVPLAVVLPYPVVWFSHFFIEKNRPATFGHPAWSWLADQRMVALMLRGKMDQEVRRIAGEG